MIYGDVSEESLRVLAERTRDELLQDKHPLTVATALDRVASDPQLRDRLAEAGRRRAQDFALDRTRQHFADSLSAVLDRERTVVLDSEGTVS